jgi:DNA segregation ATPase FtsK/SpoIIIE-like protein
MDNHHQAQVEKLRPYLQAVAYVLHRTDATRRWLLRRVKLPGGVPFRFVGEPVAGPQCVTVTMQIRDEDLKTVLNLGDRLAMAAGSEFARVYRDLAFVRIEFTLPRAQWREVHLSDLPHRPSSATIGQKALGPIARVDWTTPHKAIFGSTRSGKTTCLADFIISLARTHPPDDYRFLILNPKNDPALQPFARLAHLAAPLANTYDDSATMLRFALAEMERRRQGNRPCDQRLVIFLDEIAQLTQVNPETGPLVTQLSQMAGGLNINLVVASQAANPTVFGQTGSLAKANFPSRIVFRLPREQAYMGTGLEGQQTDKLGGDGDGLAITNSKVTRFRAAFPQARDYDTLPRGDAAPELPPADALAGDQAIDDRRAYLDRLAYALVIKNSATAIRTRFGGGTAGAMQVRDDATYFKQRVRHWRQQKQPVS